MTHEPRDVLVTGATGYIGRQLIPTLVARGHRVRALTRASSASHVPAGATAVIGDALNVDSIANALRANDTVVHLVGTPHPNPSKAKEFERVDLGSALAMASAAQRIGVRQVVYVSVAHPAPTMHAYIAARVAGEAALREAGVSATFVRPWYVLGPGHRWPIVLTPLYALGRLIPTWRDGAQRLGLVTLSQMVTALVAAVETERGKGEVVLVDVPGILAARLGAVGVT